MTDSKSFQLTGEHLTVVMQKQEELLAYFAAKRAARAQMHGIDRRSNDRRVGDRRDRRGAAA